MYWGPVNIYGSQLTCLGSLLSCLESFLQCLLSLLAYSDRRLLCPEILLAWLRSIDNVLGACYHVFGAVNTSREHANMSWEHVFRDSYLSINDYNTVM
jgi:hypothetical protein